MDTHIETTLPRPFARPELTLPGEVPDEDEPITPLRAGPEDRLGAEPPLEPMKFPGSDEALAQSASSSEADHEGEIDDAADSTAAEPTQAERPSKRRNTLMTSAAVAVVLVAAGGMFLISPYNTVSWLGGRSTPAASHPGSAQNITLPAPVAPAATLARAPTPQHAANGVRQLPAPQLRSEDLQEIVSLHRDDAGQGRPAGDAHANLPAPAPAQANSEPQTSAPPAVAAQQPAPPPVPTQAASEPRPQVPTAVLVPSPQPPNPVTTAATLQAAPMSTPQQIQVLNLVTELGVILRDQRLENSKLRDTMQHMDERMQDYDRRLALAEARGAITAAMGGGAPPAAAASAPAAAPVTPAAVTVTAPAPAPSGTSARGSRTVAAAAPVAAQDATPRRYRVQAASPGLAMLAEVDRTGDVGNLLQVGVGDDVPGFGKVRSIAQQGTTWVLTAERGTIR
ncbi:hypothetical protein [Roseomonas mucosa]|uniref:hypothetical protein n=1 Tax=Roseomonas mucosa TaxID=207340 RepID=UPI00224537F1|nr:hypothetical protein [Roseomonas mucosa]UZO94722.1 putative membrane spanning protein [Roseomonas mucosa]